MRTIWKYPLEVTDDQVIRLPSGADILDVQAQGETPVLWALVDPEAAPTARALGTYGTGHPIPEIHQAVGMKYVGTYQLRGGGFIGHVFDLGNVREAT